MMTSISSFRIDARKALYCKYSLRHARRDEETKTSIKISKNINVPMSTVIYIHA